jgi:hypothetical protein
VDELLRQLANPNLHDIPRNLPFRVEMWDGTDQHVRWVIAASASVAVGHAAMDAAIANYPEQRHFAEWDTGDPAASARLDAVVDQKDNASFAANRMPAPISKMLNGS